MHALVATLSALFPAQTRARRSPIFEPSMSDADGLVHATTTGMLKNPGLAAADRVAHAASLGRGDRLFPAGDPTAEDRAALGCRTLDGGGMAIYQAVGAFRLFTGMHAGCGSHGAALR